MKAVCFIVQNRYEIDVRVRRKAEALVAAGYLVDAIALRSGNAGPKQYQLEGVTVHTISLGKMRSSFARYLFEYVTFFVAAFFKLASLMRKRDYVAVEVNTLPDFLIFAACYARWKGAKLILDMHEITPEFVMSKYRVSDKHWMTRLATLLERLSFKYADHVLTINEPVQRLLESRGLERRKSTIIMNSADDIMFSGASPVTNRRDAFVMMYHGTLTNLYGLDITIEALASAKKMMPNAELWILGDGPERRNLEELSRRLGVNDKVKFIGQVLPQEMQNWLRQCDIGVLATRKDVFLDYSFSNKLSEYIIMGKAVISSRLRTIRHYLSEEALAYFEPNQPAGLAEQMVRLYADERSRQQLADKAKQEYAPICWGIMKQRYLMLMEELIGSAQTENHIPAANCPVSPPSTLGSAAENVHSSKVVNS